MSNIPKPWTEEEKQFLRDNYGKKSYRDIADEMDGRSFAAVRSKGKDLALWGSLEKGFSVDALPTGGRSLDKLISDQVQAFERKGDSWKAKDDLTIQLDSPGPYALYFAGDAHTGDDGCDLGRLMYELQLVSSMERTYAINMGDLSNNWCKALSGLYAKQSVTDDEERDLVRWLVNRVPWLFIILGNHDKWSPLAQEICDNAGVTHVANGGIFKVVSGDSTLVIDARHNHKGTSQYNPSFAQAKRSYRGSPADIIIGAHIHSSGYTMLRNGITGKVSHSIRVGSFKKYDEYADSNNFDDDSISPSVLCVIDPAACAEGRVTVFHDILGGKTFLEAKVKQYEGK